MIIATADSNVYVSALNFGGLPLEILVRARSQIFQLAISEPILAEVRAVLHRKFGWLDDPLDTVISELRRFSLVITPATSLSVVNDDPDDDRVLECAVDSRSQFIVSGDKHLLRLRDYAGIRIVKPAEFLALLPKPQNAQP